MRLAAIRAVCACLGPLVAWPTSGESLAGTADDLIVVAPEPSNPDFFRSREDGWFWGKDPTLHRRSKADEKAAVEPEAKRRAAAKEPRERRPRELVEFERLKKITEEAHQIAIWSPTEENIYRYLRLLRLQMDKVSIYTDLAQHVAWKYPELSPSPEEVRPPNVLAMRAFDTQRRDERAQRLRSLARTHGIYFFFRSDCPYCHAYAPLLRAFAARFGFAILAVSLDDQPIPGFEDFVRDNGAAHALGVTRWPATFLVDPATRDVLSVGTGVLNAEELADRIFQLLEYRDESKRSRIAAESAPRQPLLSEERE